MFNVFNSWGVNYTWGVFLNYYNESVYPNRMNELSWVGSICVAFYFIIGPCNEWVTGIMGFRKMLAFATIVCPLGLMLASISNQVKSYTSCSPSLDCLLCLYFRFGTCI